MKILLLDNYDSFTYNLFHLVEQFDGVEVDVFRNDEIDVDGAIKYDRFILSPGPGLPSEAGVLKALIQKYFSEKPMLGVCLGLQAIAEVCKGKLLNMATVFHGVSTPTTIMDKNEKLFSDISSPFLTGRYHSWCIDPANLPENMRVTATDDKGFIMAMTHENQLLRGVQFHPESILTEFGKTLMHNWIFRC